MQINIHGPDYADKDLTKSFVCMITSADSRLSPMNPVYSANDERKRVSELGDRQPATDVAFVCQLNAISQYGHLGCPIKDSRYVP